MVNKHVRRCSVALVNREMQIKTILRYHFIFTRMITIKKTNTQCWEEHVEIGAVILCWWECKT